ncbi:MAG: tetratricopeptide repeat protein, partial [Candidatus Omnitrophica bacterium]|nr:tetratricopeptide repeat protein [Candidatus Omnitrophota bacterium]
GRLDEDLFETTRKISESINRALLNIESLPTFYCFIKSDILRTGGVDLLRLDSYDLVFIPDQIRLQIISWALGIPVSTKELSERVVTVQIPSIDSEILKDIEGNYIHKYDIPLTEFILLLIQQNIIRTFLSAEHKDDYEFNDLTMGYASGTLNIGFNIKFKKFKENLSIPLEKIEEITRKVIGIYSSFVNIPRVVINDTFNDKTRTITFASNPDLMPTDSIADIKSEQTNTLSKLSQASLYTALAYDLRTDQKNLLKAAEFCKKALEVFPRYLYAQTLLAEIYSLLNQPEQALLILQDAAIKDPHNPILHFNLGEFYRVSGKFQEALNHFEDAALFYPQYPGISLKLCLVHISLGDLKEASAYLEQAVKQTIEQKIEDPENYRLLGDSYTELGQYQKALIYLNKAKDSKPDYLPVYLSLGRTYRLLANSDESIKNLQKALALNPDYGLVHFELAHTYLLLGQHELAINEYKKAIQLSPESSEIYIDLALAHTELGLAKSKPSEYKKAIGYLKKALKSFPTNSRIYYRLGENYANLGKNNAAAEYFQKSIELNPGLAESYFGLGRAWYALGQNDKAKENFLKAHNIFYERKDYLNARKAEENLRNIP